MKKELTSAVMSGLLTFGAVSCSDQSFESMEQIGAHCGTEQVGNTLTPLPETWRHGMDKAEYGRKTMQAFCDLVKSNPQFGLNELAQYAEESAVILPPLEEKAQKFPFDVPKDKIGIYFATEDETYLGGLAGNPPEEKTRGSYFEKYNTLVVYVERSNPLQLMEATGHELKHGLNRKQIREQYGDGYGVQSGYDEVVAYDAGFKALWAAIGEKKFQDFANIKFDQMTNKIKASTNQVGPVAPGNNDAVSFTPDISDEELVVLFEGKLSPDQAKEMKSSIMLAIMNFYLSSTGDDQLWETEMTRVHKTLGNAH